MREFKITENVVDENNNKHAIGDVVKIVGELPARYTNKGVFVTATEGITKKSKVKARKSIKGKVLVTGDK